LVSLSVNIAGADEVARNIAMQAAAMSSIALDENGVDADTIAKGKLARFFKDNTLVNQDYIKDNKLSVAAYAKSLDKDLIVTGFKRAALG
jgi:elongation factor Ts